MRELLDVWLALMLCGCFALLTWAMAFCLAMAARLTWRAIKGDS